MGLSYHSEYEMSTAVATRVYRSELTQWRRYATGKGVIPFLSFSVTIQVIPPTRRRIVERRRNVTYWMLLFFLQ